MIFLFPLANKQLSSSAFYNFVYDVFKAIFQGMSYHDFGWIYIAVRKLIHFIGYAVLALLLFRAFGGLSAKVWDPKWILYAAVISVAYGITDEVIQKYLPNRHGNFIDVLIDTSGIFLALGWVFLRKKKILARAE